MQLLESNIEAPSVALARKMGYIVLKLTPQGQRGWPDRLFINEFGHHLYIEFKRPGERLRRLQEHRCEQLANRNIAVYRNVDNIELVKEILHDNLWKGAP
jgi:hypothetical protein